MNEVSIHERYNREINNLQNQNELYKNPNRSKIEPKLQYSMLLINNMDSYMRDAKVEVKCKLLSSVFFISSLKLLSLQKKFMLLVYTNLVHKLSYLNN